MHHRTKDVIIVALLVIIALMFIGYIYHINNITKTTVQPGIKKNTSDCMIISSKDAQTRLTVVPCAQAPSSPQIIKVVPIR